MTETHADTSGESHVLVDVGDGAGALVILTGPSHVGREIHISPYEAPDALTHVEVHARDAGGAMAYAALFPSLPEGAYIVHDAPGTARLLAVVHGGSMTEVRWD